MEFVELTEKEFDKFASKHQYNNFYQTSAWGHLKKTNGWKMYLLGIKEDKKIVAATLLLEKKTPLKYNMFYAPRGFLIDYDNSEILNFFNQNIKRFAKKKKGIFYK